MAKIKGVYGTVFCGNEVSDYGKEHGFVDYATLAKAFDAVLANDLIPNTQEVGYWELDNGSDYYYEDEDGNRYSPEEYEELDEEKQEKCNEIYYDIYQYYVISHNGAEILSDYTNEIVFYNEKLDMYVWGVTHWGTMWSGVLTDIKLNMGDAAYDYMNE